MDARIELDDAQVRAALQRLQALGRPGAQRSILADIGRFMRTSMQMRFRRQTGPDGMRWTASQRAISEGGQTLRDSNRLFRSLTWRADRSAVEAGTNVVYAAAHQFGVRDIVTVAAHRRVRRTEDKRRGVAKATNHQVKSHTRRMFLPARPFAGFSRDDRTEILAILREGVERALSG